MLSALVPQCLAAGAFMLTAFSSAGLKPDVAKDQCMLTLGLTPLLQAVLDRHKRRYRYLTQA